MFSQPPESAGAWLQIILMVLDDSPPLNQFHIDRHNQLLAEHEKRSSRSPQMGLMLGPTCKDYLQVRS